MKHKTFIYISGIYGFLNKSLSQLTKKKFVSCLHSFVKILFTMIIIFFCFISSIVRYMRAIFQDDWRKGKIYSKQS